ncbi:MAG: CehA/McbA family metallohydrolase [Ginsengibacter sp.]
MQSKMSKTTNNGVCPPSGIKIFSLVFSILFLVQILPASSQNNVGNLSIIIFENKVALPCNVQLKDDKGIYWYPDSLYKWKDFNGKVFEGFPCDGKFEIALPYGKYYYEVNRGPAYKELKGFLYIDKKEIKEEWQLEKLIDLKQRNFYAGETHIHRKISDLQLLMRASDLNVGEVVTSWNDQYPADKVKFYTGPVKFDHNRYYNPTASEDERGGGALLFLNLSAPLNFLNRQMEYPPLTKSIYEVLKKNKEAWVDLEKPFWRDMPILLATNRINSIGIANNHMLKNGIFDTEGWGKKRDMVKYPSPLGNAYWTQDIYYQILNAGFRIPPSAGSASGVLLNPVGYNRLYAYVDGAFSYKKYWEAVRQGKCFVSNGPLLLASANKQMPGYVFKVSGNGKLNITIESEIYSRDSITSIEIVKNGKIYAVIGESDIKKNKFTSQINFDRSGWFLLRAISISGNNFRFSSTAPFYVEDQISKKYVSASSCVFFLNWIDERQASIKKDDEEHLEEITHYIIKARKFWNILLSKANAE